MISLSSHDICGLYRCIQGKQDEKVLGSDHYLEANILSVHAADVKGNGFGAVCDFSHADGTSINSA